MKSSHFMGLQHILMTSPWTTFTSWLKSCLTTMKFKHRSVQKGIHSLAVPRFCRLAHFKKMKRPWSQENLNWNCSQGQARRTDGETRLYPCPHTLRLIAPEPCTMLHPKPRDRFSSQHCQNLHWYHSQGQAHQTHGEAELHPCLHMFL